MQKDEPDTDPLREIHWVRWSLVAAGLVLLAGGGLLGYIRHSMVRVLEQDIASHHGTTSNQVIARRMQAISLNGCPGAFVKAWEPHLRAWVALGEAERRYVTLRASHPRGAEWPGDFDDWIGWMSEEKAGPEQLALRKAYVKGLAEIDSTWEEVLRVCDRFYVVAPTH